MLNSRDYAIIQQVLYRALGERTDDQAQAVMGTLKEWIPNGPEREAVDVVLHVSFGGHEWRELLAAYAMRMQVMAVVTAQEERRDPSADEFPGDACPGCAVPRGAIHRDGCLYERCGKCGTLRAGCVCDYRENEALIQLFTTAARSRFRAEGGPQRISRIP